MDLRNPVVGILVGGSPAPGVNGVISAVTLEALNQSCTVIGFYEGFKQMKQGISMTTTLEAKDVSRIHDQGGSILRTSKRQVSTAKEVDNCLRVLEMHRVRYLVTIGGTETAYSVSMVAKAAQAAKIKLSIVHVPKTIFNDLPLPDGSRTFGFSTAREVGSRLAHNFHTDARTMLRWYVLVVMGQKAGHLALGIGKAAAATVTIIPEEFKNKKVTFSTIADMLEASIYKRKALGKEYGVAVLAEGLVELMDQKEVTERWGGDSDAAHQEIGRHLAVELTKRFAKQKVECTVVARNLGNECRAADPNADDAVLTRDLGFGAMHYLLEGQTGAMIAMKGNDIVSIPFESVMNPKTGMLYTREVDVSKMFYRVSQSYMFKLFTSDIQNIAFLHQMAQAANMTPEAFLARFASVAEFESKRKYPTTIDAVTSGVNYKPFSSPSHSRSGSGASWQSGEHLAVGASHSLNRAHLLSSPANLNLATVNLASSPTGLPLSSPVSQHIHNQAESRP